ncbi:DUF4238 domain-containing protein [Acetobacter cerevisiae]|uniref:DUF4238 domain-containing protein n=1 Tax=Acetobacter cerevisiae TaxID=178900 RepID=A0ABT1EVI5_9PROT|nr:DUF4238 domain-containing protein [Acetobacter cerevisiae]MCP1247304.1 DUF4238 domain-containing protein [Acetobacter cerevisiae]MCP1256864.1 DUF4238 domain-containing protein [Acetobacter cerevisiae]
MAITRDNHFVPQWYQRGFFERDRSTLAYLDLEPPTKVLSNGRVIQEKSLFDAPTKRCFFRTDLYSTFFGTAVNDEIERKLFGDIDTRGSKAVKAFAGTAAASWNEHFRTFFEYIDIQKLRTPKGLAWLSAQYPTLNQNELMMEMQGIRMLHTTIWTQCVREIVSAEDADVKFIVTDHPVTIYNHALPPEAAQCAFPHDPGIALRASQTLFPLDRNHCLILTNLEYAKNPLTAPLEKRTFARNFRQSIVRTDRIIRKRRLTDIEVSGINHVMKARAQRHIAAGRQEWLYPEKTVTGSWSDLAPMLLPPHDELWKFGGETFVGFRDGSVSYQDTFGRTEKEWELLKKVPPAAGGLASNALCGCGSGYIYRICCQSRPAALRPSWTQLSIRERNLALHRGILSILGMDAGKTWNEVRKELTEDQIKDVYYLYEALWPLETDLLSLLPKRDGRPRAVYTGALHPQSIAEFAIGASLYFGELIVENPFVHAGTIAKKYRPTEHPQTYHLEFLKSVAFFLNVMPMVDAGLINLIPNPWTFDDHLHRQTVAMAEARASGLRISPLGEARLEELVRQDGMRDVLMWPRAAHEARIRKNFPEIDDAGCAEMLHELERMKEQDPLTALQDNIFEGGKEGGQMRLMQTAPNFEMTMYLAQATGAFIVTDSAFRWQEILLAARPRLGALPARLQSLATKIADAEFLFPEDPDRIVRLAHNGTLEAYPRLFSEMFRYMASAEVSSLKPNFEAGLAARFARTHEAGQKVLLKRGESGNMGRISCVFSPTGIQDNTINRLLLMSSSEHHLHMVPMAFYIQRPDPAS